MSAEAPTHSRRRIERERRTVRAMIGIHCRRRHGSGAALCGDCAGLFDYTERKLKTCRFKNGKPVCAACLVHCFGAEERERIRAVMRDAGPRMAWRHPIWTLGHLLDRWHSKSQKTPGKRL